MKFERGQLVTIKDQPGGDHKIFGMCIVLRSPYHNGPYCLWSTKKQNKVYIYEQYLSPTSTGERE
jgi:hypothetical protein